MRTLFANHCQWCDVLIVRGRCFRPTWDSSQKDMDGEATTYAASRVLNNLLWHRGMLVSYVWCIEKVVQGVA